MRLTIALFVAFAGAFIQEVLSFSTIARVPKRLITHREEVVTGYENSIEASGAPKAPVVALDLDRSNSLIDKGEVKVDSAEPENKILGAWNVFVKGLSSGDSFKQSLADALAGPDLDLSKANEKIDAIVKSNPAVVFSWTVSPFSKKAKRYLDDIGAKYTVVELDQPWSEGNPIRSALGRRVGRTSVPAIFIAGKYIGGCEDGPNEESPGLVKLAFQGRLRPILIEAGALEPDSSVDFVPSYARRAVVAEGGVSYRQQSVAAAPEPGTESAPAQHVEASFEDLSVNNNDDDCPSDDACELA